MLIKNLRRYLDMLPSDFDDKEIRFVNGGNVFVMGKYVEPVDENDNRYLNLRMEVEKW